MRAQQADSGDNALYASHQKIYPREVSGRFTRLRVLGQGLFIEQARSQSLPAHTFMIGLVKWLTVL